VLAFRGFREHPLDGAGNRNTPPTLKRCGVCGPEGRVPRRMNSKALNVAAQPRAIQVRTKRGTIQVIRKPKGSRTRGTIPRQIKLPCTQAVLRDYAARVANLGGSPHAVLVALLLATNADHTTGRVDPRWTTQEQLARFGPSPATIRRCEDWLVRHGLLLRERVQLTRRKRIRVLVCVFRNPAIPTTHAARSSTAHGERSSTAHGERLGVRNGENPPTPTATDRKKSSSRPEKPLGAPPLPLRPPYPDSVASLPPLHDERASGASESPDPEPSQDERASGASVTPDAEGVTPPLRASYRAGDSIPRAPRPERSPEAFRGKNETRNGLATPADLRQAREVMAGRPRVTKRSRVEAGPVVDRDIFAQLEARAGVRRC